MKDRLGTAAWINSPVKNRTQTIYTRFIQVPNGEIKSSFTEGKAAFDKFKNDALTTRYTRMEG